MRFDPPTLAQACGGRLVRNANAEITSAFIDSRTPIPGGLFVPIVADRDGHDFIAAALRGGAAAVLCHAGTELPDGNFTAVEVDDTLAAFGALAAHARSQCAGPVVAITGSNGKTTTRAMVEAVLRTRYDAVLCTRGNLNNHLGVPLTLLGEPHEPDAMVVEFGMSAPGENAHLASIARPTVSIITSVALEHLEFMGSIEAIARAEAEVVDFVPPHGAVIVPGEEETLRPYLGEAPTLIRQGVGPFEVRIKDDRLGSRTEGTIVIGDRELAVSLRIFGLHNLRNAASALAVAHHLGLDLDRAARALADVEPVGDRGKVLEWSGHRIISDCYNANPGSMDVALRSLAKLREHTEGPLLAVLGDMLELGPRSPQLHAEVGALAARLGLDGLCGVGPLSAEMTRAAQANGLTSTHVSTPDAAADWIREMLAGQPAGAILLKASRGIRLEGTVNALLA